MTPQSNIYLAPNYKHVVCTVSAQTLTHYPGTHTDTVEISHKLANVTPVRSRLEDGGSTAKRNKERQT